MKEMKNPSQQTNRLAAQALIAIVLIVFGFFWVQQITHQKVASQPHAKTLGLPVPFTAVSPQASTHTDELELLAKPFFVALY